MNSILLFNPRASNHKPRIPNSVLQVAASVDLSYDWVIVDGIWKLIPGKKLTTICRKENLNTLGVLLCPAHS